jgi:hypothetical protein
MFLSDVGVIVKVGSGVCVRVAALIGGEVGRISSGMIEFVKGIFALIAVEQALNKSHRLINKKVWIAIIENFKTLLSNKFVCMGSWIQNLPVQTISLCDYIKRFIKNYCGEKVSVVIITAENSFP